MPDPFETKDELKKHAGDTDLSWDSLHHTLGKGTTQAAAGKHTHKISEIEGLQEELDTLRGTLMKKKDDAQE